MAKPVLAMEKNEVKAMIRRAGAEAMNCAVLTGKDAGVALFRLDVRKGAKILLGTLQADFPDGKMPAYGTARVGPEDETTLLVTLNKVPGGTARRILKAIKGSGIKRLEITGEDGSSDSGLDEEGDAGPAEGVPPPPGPVPGQPDRAAVLKGVLARLVAQVSTLPDPAQKGEAAALARSAGAQLLSGDLDAAAASVEGLRAVLANPGAGPGQAKPAEGSVVRLATGMKLWNSVRAYLVRDLQTLQQAILEQSADEPDFDEIKGSIGNLEVVLEGLDDSLLAKLDGLRSATDAAEKLRLSEEARAIVRGYQEFCDTDPLMNALDDNGFVKLDTQAKMRSTLAAILTTI